jgi:hypothetical protein
MRSWPQSGDRALCPQWPLLSSIATRRRRARGHLRPVAASTTRLSSNATAYGTTPSGRRCSTACARTMTVAASRRRPPQGEGSPLASRVESTFASPGLGRAGSCPSPLDPVDPSDDSPGSPGSQSRARHAEKKRELRRFARSLHPEKAWHGRCSCDEQPSNRTRSHRQSLSQHKINREQGRLIGCTSSIAYHLVQGFSHEG